MKITKHLIALLAIFMLASCQDLFNDKDIKKNPNAPEDAPYDILVSGALTQLAELHEDTDTRIACMWVGQLTGLSRQHLGFAKYNVNSTNFGWDAYYLTAANARLIQDKTAPSNNQQPLGAGQVIEVLAMLKLTSLWGDIPYSEALDVVNHPTPKFDSQASVYAALIAKTQAAVTNLAGPGNWGAAVDFVYNKSGSKWKAAANTLLARLLLHTGDYAGAKAAAAAGISSTAGDFLIPHGTSYNVDMNLNYVFFDINRPADTGCSYSEDLSPVYLPELLQSRIGGTNTKTDESALFGHYFLDSYYVNGGIDPNTVDGMFVQDAPHVVLSFYENKLILAEAEARLGNLQAAVDALNSVRSTLATGYISGKTIDPAYQALGLQYDNYVLADFGAAGIANPAALGTQQEAILREVLTQKYILSFMQYEAFNDYRRAKKATPVVSIGIPAYKGLGASIPLRYLVPQTEINVNPNTPNPVPAKDVNVPIWQ